MSSTISRRNCDSFSRRFIGDGAQWQRSTKKQSRESSSSLSSSWLLRSRKNLLSVTGFRDRFSGRNRVTRFPIPPPRAVALEGGVAGLQGWFCAAYRKGLEEWKHALKRSLKKGKRKRKREKEEEEEEEKRKKTDSVQSGPGERSKISDRRERILKRDRFQADDRVERAERELELACCCCCSELGELKNSRPEAEGEHCFLAVHSSRSFEALITMGSLRLRERKKKREKERREREREREKFLRAVEKCHGTKIGHVPFEEPFLFTCLQPRAVGYARLGCIAAGYIFDARPESVL